MNPEPRTIAAGVDIGGTKIAIGLVDRAGKILAERTFPTEAALGFERTVGRIVAAVEECLREAGRSRDELEGIGVGCAGPVHPGRGTIDNPYTLPTWDGVDIVTPLKAAFDRPAYLENDADAAAVGEAYFGAGAGCRSLVMLTFGTGVGSGVLIDGRIYRGAQETHPELGHLPVATHDFHRKCYCGHYGCLESIASGTAIDKAAREEGLGDGRTFLAGRQEYARDKGPAGALVAAIQNGVYQAVWTIQHTFLPERIIFGGGIIDEHFEFFAAEARRAVEKSTMNPRGCTQVVQAALGNKAGIVGAAHWARVANLLPRGEGL